MIERLGCEQVWHLTDTVALVAVQVIAGVTVATVASLAILTRVFTAAVVH